jgi:3-deoxy-7-phosphoheptulonate synthase
MTTEHDPSGRPLPKDHHIPFRVGYQGQPGSFGERAALRAGLPEPYPSFDRLLRALLAGEVEGAVLPAVTRAAGPLVEPLEALAATISGVGDLHVTAEIVLPNRFVLAAPHGTDPDQIREVFSQAPVLRQCRNLLARLKAEVVETPDTAAAADQVAASGGLRAAVCSEEAALAAGLALLEEDVSDVRPNATRFWVLQTPDGVERRKDHAPVRMDLGEPSLDAGIPLSVPLQPRVVWFAGVRRAAILAEAGAEIVSLPGEPDAPVRGFAIVSEKSCGTIAVKAAGGSDAPLVWLGPPPDFVRPPRVHGIPRTTEVRPPTIVEVGGFVVGGGRRAVIAGPCTVESEEQIHRIAKAVARAGATALRGGVFKPRSSPYAFQGHGLEALVWLKEAGLACGLPVVTEVMAPAQVVPVAKLADILQIGARNCQNYDLLKESATVGRPVLLKRGFGTTVEEWLGAAEYLLAGGCDDVMLCERGIRTFERSTRGTLDIGGILAARSLTHLPILADPSHASGRREWVPGLARASWGAGVDGLIVEVHDRPEEAFCDGPQALLPSDLEELLDAFGFLPGASGSVERIRTAIDTTDHEIGRLVARRLELCRRVAAAKHDAGRPLRDEEREAAVRKRFVTVLAQAAPGAGAERLADLLIGLGLEAEGWKGDAPA